MSLGFGATFGTASTDRIISALSGATTEQTIAFAFNRNGAGGGGLGRIFSNSETSQDTNTCYWNNVTSTTPASALEIARGQGRWLIDVPSTGVWYAVAFSHDTSVSTNTPLAYVDGASATVTERGANALTFTNDAASAWWIGNRASDQARGWDGVIAEFAVWNVVLTADEMRAVTLGFSPELIRPSALIEYLPLVSTPAISRKRAQAALTGAVARAHPRIIRPMISMGKLRGAIAVVLSPDQDVTDDGWTDQIGGSDLFEAINESAASDADYIVSPAFDAGDPARTARVSLSNPSGHLVAPVTVRYRYGAFGSQPLTLTVRLFEGDIQIASWQHADISPGSIIAAEQTLTAGEFASIIDVTDLFLEFRAEPHGADNPIDMFGSDLVLWLDAGEGVYNDAGTTLATNGQTVRQWNDQSGNGYHVSQATSGNRPTLNTTGLNGLPAVEFTDATDFMLTATDAVALGGTAISGFAVIRFGPGNDSANNRIWSFVANGSSNDYDNIGSCTVHTADNGQFIAASRNNDFWISPLSFTAGTNYRFGGIWDGTDFTTYRDNVAGTPAASAGTFGSTGTIAVAANPGEGAVSALDGTIAELVIVKRALSSGERAALDAYFVAKWGL